MSRVRGASDGVDRNRRVGGVGSCGGLVFADLGGAV